MKRISKLLALTKRSKANIADFVILLLSINAIMLVFDNYSSSLTFSWKDYLTVCSFFLFFYFVFQFVFKTNNIMWEYLGGKSFITLFMIILITSLITFCLYVLIFGFSLWKMAMFMIMMFTLYSELVLFKMIFVRLYVVRHQRKHHGEEPQGNKNNTIIIGAGWTGTNLAKAFENDQSIFKPVCYIDDDPQKLHRRIAGLPVAGMVKDLEKVVASYHVKKIIFAIPYCPKAEKKRIINACIATKCVLKVVPPLQEMVNQFDTSAIRPRDVRIEDLLGREPMVFDYSNIEKNIKDKVVLVTGGGGSIGSELCRQIAKCEPKQLIIMDIYENNAYDIQMELKRHYPNLNLEVSICSIADYERCKILFETFRPELVFHAAAHKHVPLMEHVPEQAIKNNVVGTWNLCSLSAEYGVRRFLLISTDKAVNPTNVMGASKRCCEMIVKYHAQRCKDTVYCAVRFGNVLGSNGSVIPLFRNQIMEGGPVTITDKNIIRYFMTIPEAVSLVLETGTMSKSGEIYVLDMGEPVKILDLAENMIRLMGYKPYEDIGIKFTGLRPGEKLYEELLIQGEGMTKTENKKIFICQQIDVDEEEFKADLDTLVSLARQNKPEEVMAQLRKMIPTYHTPNNQ